MDVPEHVVAKMRQLLFDHTMVPSEAGVALAWIVTSTRPWTDEQAVSRGLRSWADQFWGKGSLDPGLADGAGQVAERLQELGPAALDDGPMVFITLQMLGNVAKGRTPTESNVLRDTVKGFPKRTLRRYRQQAREMPPDEDDIGPDWKSFRLFLASLQYDLDVAALVKSGRKPATARRWLKRNKGKHAADAPPPRARRGDGS